MVPQLGEEQAAALDFIDHAMLLGDASRPVAGQGMAQWLRLADPLEGVAHRILDQFVNAAGDLPIGLQPILVVVPGLLGKDQPHAAWVSRLSLPLPRARLSMACKSRRALAGLRSK